MRISSGSASHCVRNQDNQALSGGSDRKALRKAVRTSATTMEGRGAGESFPHFSAQPRDRRSTGRQPVLCDRTCDRTWDSSVCFPFIMREEIFASAAYAASPYARDVESL